jgi:hypothetical protein
VAAAVGNFLSYRELAVPMLKSALREYPVRHSALSLSQPEPRA